MRARCWRAVPVIALWLACADRIGLAVPAADAADLTRAVSELRPQAIPEVSRAPLPWSGLTFATTRGPIVVAASGAEGRTAEASFRFGYSSDVHGGEIIQAHPAADAVSLPVRPGTDITALLESLGPGSYVIPSGRYFGADIDLGSGVRLYGQGAASTEIKLPGGSIDSHQRREHIYLLDLTSTRGVHLSGLRLDGNKDEQVLHNTRTLPSPGWYVGPENGGWHVIQANGASDLVLAGIVAANAGTDGLNIGEGARNISVLASRFDGNRRQGVSVKDVDGLAFREVTFSNTGGQKPEAGVDLEPNNAADTIRNVSFYQTHFVGNNGAGLMVDSRGAALDGLLIERSTFLGRRGLEVKGRRHEGHTAVLANVMITENEIEGDVILGGSGEGGGVHENTIFRENKIGGRLLIQKAGPGSSFAIEDNYTPDNGEVAIVQRD